MKNPTIATILNIIPGLGYIYIGGKKMLFGWLLLAGMVAAFASTFDPRLNLYSEEAMSSEFTAWSFLGILSTVITIAAFMYDAYVSTNSINSLKQSKKNINNSKIPRTAPRAK